MNSPFSRRDFLKLTGLAPLGLASPSWTRLLGPSGSGPNVIVLVFDAFSASNIPLYGYGRMTTPNLARLADRAIVYHNHFAASNFTTSGTASLLTGTLPWTNRAIEDGSTVENSLLEHNLFCVFSDYYRTACTHNTWAMRLLYQFRRYLDDLVPQERMFLQTYDEAIHTSFAADDDIADVAWTRYAKLQGGFSYSLFLSHGYQALRDAATAGLASRFPRGIPMDASSDAFLLEQSTDWLEAHLRGLPQPFLGYFHFLPPHDPYHTSLEFMDRFKGDRLRIVVKPMDAFRQGYSVEDLREQRRDYDEYILYADQALGSLYDFLERSRLLDNTWLIVTSDHGETFERGLLGHGQPTLYQPVVRVPLLIFEPGRKVRTDILTQTSAVDLLPALAHVTGHAVPDWAEGLVLPPFSSSAADPNRSILAVTARKSQQKAPLRRATMMLVQGPYKLVYYLGYTELGLPEAVTLYDIQADPEELVELSSSHPAVTAGLLAELKGQLARADQPYL